MVTLPEQKLSELSSAHILRPKCRSRHKATMVIAVRAHCNPLMVQFAKQEINHKTDNQYYYFQSDILFYCFIVAVDHNQ